jgi:hypothetical protein
VLSSPMLTTETDKSVKITNMTYLVGRMVLRV